MGEETMTDVPVIPPAGMSSFNDPPQPASTPGGFGGRRVSEGRLSDFRQSVDDRLLATSDDEIKNYWKYCNGGLGALIMTNGLLRCLVVSMSLEFFIMSCWLVIFGLIFVLVELNIQRVDSLLKANVEFMYFPGFRAFFLTFVGTMMWWWWFGILVSCLCFLGAIFNYYIMKTHPAFGHSNADTYSPPDVEQGSGHLPAEYGDQYGNAKL